jgi:hypothetical protein
VRAVLFVGPHRIEVAHRAGSVIATPSDAAVRVLPRLPRLRGKHDQRIGDK